MKKLLFIFATLAGLNASAQQIWVPGGNTTIGTSTTPSTIGIGTSAAPPSGLGGTVISGGINRGTAMGLYIQRSDNPATNQDGGLKINITGSNWGPVLAGGSVNFQCIPTSNSIAPDMGFSCNSTAPQLVIKNTGNVGIGTSAPGQLLDVTGTTRTKRIMITNGAAVNSILQCTATSGLAAWVPLSSLALPETDPKVGTLSSNYLPKWGTTSLVDSKISEISNGVQVNLGIGTSTIPQTNHGVTMSGGINNPMPAGLYLERNDINPATNQNCALSILFSSNAFSATGIGGGSCAFRLFPSSNTPQPDIAFSCNAVAPQLIIKNGGNVGIGTASPGEKLEVNSGVGGKSGLKFTNLTSTSPLSTPSIVDFDCNLYLTVDNTGEVILVNKNTCTSSSKSAGSDIDPSAQQAQVDALQSQVEELKNEIAEMKAMFSTATVKSTKMSSSISNVHLSQIAPNPFSQNATISFSLPADVTNAQLQITDLSGKVLKSYSINSGATQQVINGNELSAGSYLYSISVNGKVIDSKQMVVTH